MDSLLALIQRLNKRKIRKKCGHINIPCERAPKVLHLQYFMRTWATHPMVSI